MRIGVHEPTGEKVSDIIIRRITTVFRSHARFSRNLN